MCVCVRASVPACECVCWLPLSVSCRSVLSSGDELVECTAADCPAGCVRDSNRPLLLSLLSSAGCAEVVDLGIVRDDETSLSSVLSPSRLRSLDCVVCTGGVSMGELDLLKGWLASRGRLLFGRVNMKPGKPTTFAVLDRQNDGTALPDLPFFALPGNPVSAFASCHLFVLPALQRLRGVSSSQLQPDSGYARCSVAVMGGVARDPQRVDYHRCTVYFDSKRGGLVALSTGSQQSSRLMSAAHANAMLVLQPGDKPVQHGEIVDALLIDRVKVIAAAELSTLVARAAHGQQTAAHHSHHSHHQHSHGHSEQQHGSRHQQQPGSTVTAAASAVGAVSSPVSISVALVTVSDRVASGQAQDASGPAIDELLRQYSNQQPQSVILPHSLEPAQSMTGITTTTIT